MQTLNSAFVTYICLLYTSDAADDMQCVDLGGRRIIKKLTEGGLWLGVGLGWCPR